MANEEMNLAAMRKLMEENAKKAEENGETAIVGRGWMDKLATEESAPAPTPNPVAEPVPVPVEEAPATYNGPGLIINQVEETEPQQAFAGVSPRTSADIESYLAEMDEEKARILIQAEGVSEEMLDKSFHDYINKEPLANRLIYNFLSLLLFHKTHQFLFLS